MAVTDTLLGGRSIREGTLPVPIVLSAAVEVGDLLASSGGTWVQADANAGLPARLIAASAGASGATIIAYAAAVVDVSSGSGDLTVIGDEIGLSDTVGEIVIQSTGTTPQEQSVGFTANTGDDTWVFTGGLQTLGRSFEDNAMLQFGDSGDAMMQWDATRLRLVPAVDNASLYIGNGTTSFDVTTWGSTTSRAMTWDASADMLSIDQDTADTSIMEFRSSTDVAHVLTTGADINQATATWLAFAKAGATTGGAIIQATAENGATSNTLKLSALGGTAVTTIAETNLGLMQFYVAEHNGANALSTVLTDGIAFAFRANIAGTDRSILLLDEEGQLHADESATVGLYDEHDDPILLRDARVAISNWRDYDVKKQFGKFIKYNRDMLEDLKIVHFSPTDGSPFVNLNRLLYLACDSIWQLNEKLEHRVTELSGRLTASEQKLALLS
jgi:hypothetical protein